MVFADSSLQSNVNYHEEFMLARLLAVADLHGRVGDGLHLGPLGMLVKAELLTVTHAAELEVVLVKLRDHNLPRDEEWFSGEREQPLVQEVEEETLHVVSRGLDLVRVCHLHRVDLRHVPEHGDTHVLESLGECVAPGVELHIRGVVKVLVSGLWNR